MAKIKKDVLKTTSRPALKLVVIVRVNNGATWCIKSVSMVLLSDLTVGRWGRQKAGKQEPDIDSGVREAQAERGGGKVLKRQ